MDSSNPYQSPSPTGFGGSSGVAKLTPKEILFSFSGRIPRKTFWIWAIILWVVFAICGGIIGAIAGPGTPKIGPDGQMIASAPGALFWLLMVILYIPAIWTGLALQIKRWHDRGKPGIWVLINLIPFIGGLWALIECGFLRGTVGPNQFGPDPTEP